MRRLIVAGVALLGILAAAGCGDDDGGDVRELEGGSGSGSGTGSGSGSGSGSGVADVPPGVVAQYQTLAEEIAAEGGEVESGEWRVAYIVEPAEPWFVHEDDSHEFRPPAEGETHHLEIIPFELATGRVVPGVPVRLEVLDASGAVVDAKDLDFYYAEFFHYASNFSIPEAGAYTLRATLGAPEFLRHGEEAEGPALAEGVVVEFPDVQLEPAE